MKTSVHRSTITIAQVCEGMVDYVEKFQKFPTIEALKQHLDLHFDLKVSSSHLYKLMKRAKNIAFSAELTGVHMLTAQVIMNHYLQTFQNVKAVELWYKIFFVELNELKERESELQNDNVLEVRIIDAAQTE